MHGDIANALVEDVLIIVVGPESPSDAAFSLHLIAAVRVGAGRTGALARSIC